MSCHLVFEPPAARPTLDALPVNVIDVVTTATTKDMVEGLTAFLEKRRPRFEGD